MSSNSSGKFFVAGIIGALAGAIGGLLLAPKSGKETRKEITKYAEKLAKLVKTETEETEDRVKEVFGKVTDTYQEKYNEIKSTVTQKIASLKTAGNEIDKEKYFSIVESVVSDFKDDLKSGKNGAIKMSSQLKKDWEKFKKALA
ncbi:MAG: YtxH domain-containing protein [Candidatus Shapirobacteria bacterium]|nr:YtxH domain-containing protein [Candidatus Shapirobacteria bacterium]